MGRLVFTVLFGLTLMVGFSSRAHAQGLGWEGETGVFVTPLAYTQSTEDGKARATAAYHYLNAGSVIGDFHEVSVEVGVGKRIEFGYTHEFHTFGDNAALSELWQNGFDIMNAKINVIPENYKKMKWVPAVSVGGMARVGVRNVGNYVKDKMGNADKISGRDDGDFYLIGTKTLPTGKFPVLVSAGVRGTDAELWGMGGNAPDWTAQAFGSVAVVCPLPHKNTIIFASEAAHQPHHPYGYTSAKDFGGVKLNIPTTLTYAARFIPNWKYKVNFDVGVAQIAGNVAPGIDLKARHQVGVQMSYAF
jgi:hypothetical protein